MALLLLAGTAAGQQEVSLEKSTNGQDADVAPGPSIVAGDPVTWIYRVSNNTGRDLIEILVTDDVEGAVTCPATTLAPGESMNCTLVGIASLGQYENVGTVTALQPNEVEVSDTDLSHYLGVAEPTLELEKSTDGFDADDAPGPVLAVGSTVTWLYEVTNVGSQAVSSIEVSDDQEGAVPCPGSVLQPGESLTCQLTGTVQAGAYANLGTVTGTLPDSTPVGATDSSHYYGQTLTLEKRTNGVDADLPPGPSLAEGDPVTWTYEVQNPGPATVTGITVTDDQGVSVSCPSTSLAPRESMTCTASGVAAPGLYANLGTATGTLPSGATISASDPSHYSGPSLDLEKATNGEDADDAPGPVLPPGTPITWTYVVTNHDTTALTGVEVTDDQGVIVSCPATTVAAGESMECTGQGVAVAGQYANVGMVTATNSEETPLTASDPSHYLGVEVNLGLTASKSVAVAVDGNGDGAAGAGDTLRYTVIVSNDDTVDAVGVTFTDTPDPATSLVVGSVTTTQGTVTSGNTGGDLDVAVDLGTLAAMTDATITFDVLLPASLPPSLQQVVNQGEVDATNADPTPTDDPTEPGAEDPTVIAVLFSVLEIPTLGSWGLVMVAMLLLGAAWWRLGRS